MIDLAYLSFIQNIVTIWIKKKTFKTPEIEKKFQAAVNFEWSAYVYEGVPRKERCVCSCVINSMIIGMYNGNWTYVRI